METYCSKVCSCGEDLDSILEGAIQAKQISDQIAMDGISGIVFVDQSTGRKYRLYVSSGKLTMQEV